jgi:hypothetical protein
MLITHLSVGGLINIAWIGAIALCSWKDRTVWRLDEPAYRHASRRLRRGQPPPKDFETKLTLINGSSDAAPGQL